MARNTKVNVTTSSVEIVASDPSREETWIRNDPAGETIFLGFNEPAVADQGYFILAGESLIISSGSNRWARATAQVNAITASSTSNAYCDITS